MAAVSGFVVKSILKHSKETPMVKTDVESESNEEPQNEMNLYPPSMLVSSATNRPVPAGGKCDPDVPSFFCSICHIHLNMPLQAIQHFSGKGHAAKLSKNKNSSKYDLYANQNKNRFANMSDPTRKRNYDSINRPEPKQQIPHEPLKKKPKDNSNSNSEQKLICHHCDAMFNSASQAESHFKGKKHSLVVASKNSSVHTLAVASKTPSVASEGEQQDKYPCYDCNISLNSVEQYNQHCNGIKHKLKAGIIKEPPVWWVDQQSAFNETSTKKSSGKGVGDKFKCDTCNILLNSQAQLGQHLTSDKHRALQEKSSGRGRGRGNNQRGRGNFTRGRGGRGGGQRGRGANYEFVGHRGRGRREGSYGSSREAINTFTSGNGQCGEPIFDANGTNFLPIGHSSKQPSMLGGREPAVFDYSKDLQDYSDQRQQNTNFNLSSIPSSSSSEWMISPPRQPSDIIFDTFYHP